MDARISLVTLGVSDLARAKAFYEDMGFRGQEVQETVFVQAGSQALVLWDRAKLAADSGIDDPQPHDGYGGVALAQNVRTRGEVESVLALAAQAGATITRPAAETFYGGFAGCFTDPDGHVWEIAHNPGFTLTDDGALVLPDFKAM